jgi:hypothetical protein
MMFTFTQPVSELGACGEYGTIHTTHSIFLETGFDIFLLQLTCTTSALCCHICSHATPVERLH